MAKLGWLVLLGISAVAFAEKPSDTKGRAPKGASCESVLAEKRTSRSNPNLIGEADQYFVLDTNVLMNDANAFVRYRGTVVIPKQVIDELNGLKKDPTRGRSAREALRALDDLRRDGRIRDDHKVGYRLPSGSELVIWDDASSGHDRANGVSMDDQIVSVAVGLATEHKDKVFLISDDNGVLLWADQQGRGVGLKLSRYAPNRLMDSEGEPSDSYRGYREVVVAKAIYRRLVDTKALQPAELSRMLGSTDFLQERLKPNEVIVIREEGAPSPIDDVDYGLRAPLFRYKANLGQLVALPSLDLLQQQRVALMPRNLEQRIALELTMDPDVKIVFLSGRAGSGKNVMSFLGAVEQVYQHDGRMPRYKRILVLRNTSTIGEDIGFLPGTQEEKVAPHMQAVKDTLAAIEKGWGRVHRGDERQGGKKGGGSARRGLYEQLKMSGQLIDDEAVQFKRGSTFMDTMVIVDEAQNFRPKELDAIIDRTGEGSKVIILGDPEQVDPNYLNASNNGLAVKLSSVEQAFGLIEGADGRVDNVDLSIIGLVRLWRAERSDVVRANLILKNQQQ